MFLDVFCDDVLWRKDGEMGILVGRVEDLVEEG